MKRLIFMLVSGYWFLSSVAFAQGTGEQIKREYLNQVDLYRSLYGTYTVKKETFVRSGTYAAQEELIVASREMLIARAASWEGYFHALASQTAEHSGFDETIKSEIQHKLNNERQTLAEHKDRLTTITNKTDLLTEANFLQNRAESITQLTYSTQLATKFADMKRALMVMESLANRCREAAQAQIRDQQFKETRLRGFDELDSLLTQVTMEISHQETNTSGYGVGYANISGYEQTMRELEPAFTSVVRAQQLLHELAVGLEL